MRYGQKPSPGDDPFFIVLWGLYGLVITPGWVPSLLRACLVIDPDLPHQLQRHHRWWAVYGRHG